MSEHFELVEHCGLHSSRAAKCDFGRTYAEIVGDLVAAGMKPSIDAESKIKRWVAKGRKAGSLPPLDDLRKMAGWWREMKAAGYFKWRVPDFLETLERGTPAKPEPQAPMQSVPSKEDDAPLLENVGEDEPEAVMIQLRVFATQLRAEMKRAQSVGAEERFWRAYERHGKIAEEIRKWEKVWIERRKATKELADVAIVKAALSQLIGVASTAFTNAMIRLARKLAPDKDETELRELVLPERDACFVHLKTSDFSDAFPLPAAA